MITINILADAKYPVDRDYLREKLRRELTKNRLTEGVELTVFVVGKRKMSQLHKQYMGLSGPTDVLSFPLNDPTDDRPFLASPDGILRLGDIVVCYTEALEEALSKQVKIDEQVAYLAEHGLMHLLGYHHD